jgi:hypothetical protein
MALSSTEHHANILKPGDRDVHDVHVFRRRLAGIEENRCGANSVDCQRNKQTWLV